jgi:signal transduction histidine kinase
MSGQREPSDATTAVIAHALLNSMSVIRTATELLLEPELPDGARPELLERIRSQATHVTGVLQDLVRGLPGGALDVLQSLDQDAGD